MYRPSAFLAMLLLVLPSGAHAASGGAALTVTHSGYLLDAQDNPISGAVTLRFRVYDAEAGGTLQWEATCPSVPVRRGYYSVVLGGASCVGSTADGLDPVLDTSDLPTTAPGWLEVAVAGATLAPRREISSVPTAALAARALEADTLDGLSASEFARTAHTHDALDVSGLHPIALSGSYGDLANVPGTFAPSPHTHGVEDVTGLSIVAGAGLSGGTITGSGTLSLATTSVTPGTWGSATQVPAFTVDAMGRLTSASHVTISGVLPGGAAGGDLIGTYPSPTVAQLQGRPIAATAPTLGQVLQWNGAAWVPAAAASASRPARLVWFPPVLDLSVVGAASTATLHNEGDAPATGLSVAATTGFSVTATSCPTSPFTLAEGASCTVTFSTAWTNTSGSGTATAAETSANLALTLSGLPPATCNALHLSQPSLQSGNYIIDPDGAGANLPFTVYCDMSDDGGGWTMVARFANNGTNFAYGSSYWTSTGTLNPTTTVGLSGIDMISRAWPVTGYSQIRFSTSASTVRVLVTMPNGVNTVPGFFAYSTTTTTSFQPVYQSGSWGSVATGNATTVVNPMSGGYCPLDTTGHIYSNWYMYRSGCSGTCSYYARVGTFYDSNGIGCYNGWGLGGAVGYMSPVNTAWTSGTSWVFAK